MMSIAYTDNKELVARFEREARHDGAARSPNLVPVCAVGRRERPHRHRRKFLEGQSLATTSPTASASSRVRCRRCSSSCARACSSFTRRTRCTATWKPANVFVSPAGRSTLLDLGVARDTENQMTRSGVIVGTTRYMSPEQIPAKRVDKTADLYSAGDDGVRAADRHSGLRGRHRLLADARARRRPPPASPTWPSCLTRSTTSSRRAGEEPGRTVPDGQRVPHGLRSGDRADAPQRMPL